MVSKTPLEDLFEDLMKVGLNSQFEKGTIEYTLFRSVFFMAMFAPTMACNRGVQAGASEEDVKEAIKEELARFHNATTAPAASRFN